MRRVDARGHLTPELDHHLAYVITSSRTSRCLPPTYGPKPTHCTTVDLVDATDGRFRVGYEG